MKTALKLALYGLVSVSVLAIGAYLWASVTTMRVMARTFESHMVEFPVPFPLPDEEIEGLGLSAEEADRIALERALERGRHLVEARYACGECHGTDFGGGVMVDAFPIGRLLGPNLTSGRGSRTTAYTLTDWDRIVRHGILPDGRPTVMPSEDFLLIRTGSYRTSSLTSVPARRWTAMYPRCASAPWAASSSRPVRSTCRPT